MFHPCLIIGYDTAIIRTDLIEKAPQHIIGRTIALGALRPPHRQKVESFRFGQGMLTTQFKLLKLTQAGIILFLSGVMPDLDHAIEVIIHKGIKEISVKNVYEAFSPEHAPSFEKLYLFLHSIELAMLLWIVSAFFNNIYLIALSAGYTLHLIMDAGGNKLSKGFYFFTWRMSRRFRTNELFKKR